MKTKEMEAFSKAFAPVIKSFFEQSLAVYSKKVDEKFESLKNEISETKSFFEEAIKSLPTPENGKDGQDYPEEKAVEKLESLAEANFKKLEERIEKAENDLKEAVESIPEPKNGIDGKDYPEDEAVGKLQELTEQKFSEFKTQINSFINQCNETVAKAVSEIPTPENGKDGKDYPEEKAVAKLESLAQEKFEKLDKDFSDFSKNASETIAKAIMEIPTPKDGEDGKDAEPVSEEFIKELISELLAKAVSEIPLPENGQPGEDGRDAIQLEVLPAIEEGKSYPRGTYAKHAGGLWRAFERTHEMRGWECIVNGLSDIQIESCGLREFKIVGIMSDKSAFEKSFKLPVAIYKNVYSEKEAPYDKGDMVTFGGSVWHSNVDKNVSKPGTNNDWQLSVKKGRDYKEPAKKEPVDTSKGVKIR